jgi:hypothetical protein
MTRYSFRYIAYGRESVNIMRGPGARGRIPNTLKIERSGSRANRN